ncbi:MAG: hypothetical protein IPO41_01170 [Acidobacteria bacterium]|nr:hypothetical protein [Acidobacteriota bacterium]
MNFETFFRFISYLAVFCGFLALWVSGTFGVVESLGFVGVIVGAWFLEGSRWQISEWVGTGMIVLALPVFYLAWRFPDHYADRWRDVDRRPFGADDPEFDGGQVIAEKERSGLDISVSDVVL